MKEKETKLKVVDVAKIVTAKSCYLAFEFNNGMKKYMPINEIISCSFSNRFVECLNNSKVIKLATVSNARIPQIEIDNNDGYFKAALKFICK